MWTRKKFITEVNKLIREGKMSGDYILREQEVPYTGIQIFEKSLNPDESNAEEQLIRFYRNYQFTKRQMQPDDIDLSISE